MYICFLSESNLSSNLILTMGNFLTILFCCFDKETGKIKYLFNNLFNDYG